MNAAKAAQKRAARLEKKQARAAEQRHEAPAIRSSPRFASQVRFSYGFVDKCVESAGYIANKHGLVINEWIARTGILTMLKADSRFSVKYEICEVASKERKEFVKSLGQNPSKEIIDAYNRCCTDTFGKLAREVGKAYCESQGLTKAKLYANDEKVNAAHLRELQKESPAQAEEYVAQVVENIADDNLARLLAGKEVTL